MAPHRPLDDADYCPPSGEGYPLFVSIPPDRLDAAKRLATSEQRSLGSLMRRALYDYLDQVKATDER
jgi:hypothetical protein